MKFLDSCHSVLWFIKVRFEIKAATSRHKNSVYRIIGGAPAPIKLIDVGKRIRYDPENVGGAIAAKQLISAMCGNKNSHL